MRKSLLLATAAAALLATQSLAADAPPPTPPLPARGTVESFDGKTLTVKTNEGAQVAGAVTDKTRILYVVAHKVSDLTAKDFVGITSVPGRNGHLKAEEIHILPMVVGEGQYPWDFHPGGHDAMRASSMTNGMVSPTAAPSDTMTNGMVTPGSATEITVTYHGSEMVGGKCEGHAPTDLKTACTGTNIVDVDADTPVVSVVPGKADDIKPGLATIARLSMSDPTTFGSVIMEHDGVKPPF